MNPSSVDIKDLLVANLGLIFATDLFIGKEPATPNNVTTIFDTPGRAPSLYYDNTIQYYFPSVQIRVRNTDYLSGWNLINDIKVLLHGRANEQINNTIYTVMVCSSDPALLDWDDNNRARFIVNFDLQREPV